MGHTIIGCGRSETRIRELSRLYSSPHDFAAVNVANDAEVQAWAARSIERVGPPDLLINNAALMNDPAPLWQVPQADFDKLIDVNVKGVINVIRHFVPAMIARGSGVIVNVSSGWGNSAAPNVGPYVTSKFAVEGLTKSLALDLPRGLAAVALNPGVIDTDMLRQSWGSDAVDYENPAAWAERAAPFLMRLSAKDNGKSVSLE
jgi:NAD(P)-dependent dehydrogenase (short-subunit alcohol dehydrogenase family)